MGVHRHDGCAPAGIVGLHLEQRGPDEAAVVAYIDHGLLERHPQIASGVLRKDVGHHLFVEVHGVHQEADLFKALLPQMIHHGPDQLPVLHIDTAIGPVHQIPGTQHHGDPALAQLHISLRGILTGDDDESFHLLVQAQLNDVALLSGVAVAAVDDGAVAVLDADVLNSGDGLGCHLVAEGVGDDADETALLGLQGAGDAVGYISLFLNDVLDSLTGLGGHITVVTVQITGDGGFGDTYLSCNVGDSHFLFHAYPSLTGFANRFINIKLTKLVGVVNRLLCMKSQLQLYEMHRGFS